MNKGEKLDESELDKLFEELRQPNHQDIGKVAVEPETFGWDSEGTYLTAEHPIWEGSE
jgi:hypothetical protein